MAAYDVTCQFELMHHTSTFAALQPYQSVIGWIHTWPTAEDAQDWMQYLTGLPADVGANSLLLCATKEDLPGMGMPLSSRAKSLCFLCMPRMSMPVVCDVYCTYICKGCSSQAEYIELPTAQMNTHLHV